MPYSDWLTLDEYSDSIRKLLELELWYLDFHCKNSGEDRVIAAQKRIDLGYRSPAAREGSLPNWENPVWKSWIDILQKFGSPREKTLNAAWEMIEPGLKSSWETGPGGIWPFGCIALEEPGTWDPDPQTVFFHIGNTLAPASILQNPGYIRSSLAQAAQWARKNWGPDLVFTTESWLNSYPRWLEVLPPKWAESLGPPNKDIAWHLGFWGQFLTARGTFHHQNAKQFKVSGQMPFWPRRGSVKGDLL